MSGDGDAVGGVGGVVGKSSKLHNGTCRLSRVVLADLYS
jgi:hypothetical protein